MARNLYRLWVVLLIVSGAIALWFSGFALAGVWKFSCLNAQVPAKVLKWRIQECSPSQFAIVAEYRYEIGGTGYSGETIFENPQFLNYFAAENYTKLLKTKRWVAHYKKSQPVFSSLERHFPQKKCLQALLTVGVFAYFYFSRSFFSGLRLLDVGSKSTSN